MPTVYVGDKETSSEKLISFIRQIKSINRWTIKPHEFLLKELKLPDIFIQAKIYKKYYEFRVDTPLASFFISFSKFDFDESTLTLYFYENDEIISTLQFHSMP